MDVGQIAPDFALPSAAGNFTKLSRLLDGAEHLVVFFFLQAESPGCTKEASGFNDLLPQLEAHNVKVVGISTNSEAELAGFVRAAGLKFDLLSDADHKTAEEWGAWRGSGVARMTYVINSHGAVTHVFPRVNVNTHAQDVLALFGAPAAAEATTEAGSSSAPTAAVAPGELAVTLARASLQLLLAQLDAGASLPADVAELAARVAQHR